MTSPRSGSGAAERERETLDAAALAQRYGLVRVGTRPSLRRYLAQLWNRRHFLVYLARATAYSRHQNNYLGQLWALLNPLLLAVVYFLVFGLLLQTDGGVDNYVGFLTIGIFIFTFAATSLTAGAKSVVTNTGMIRALHFPRAVLPIASSVAELIAVASAMVVLLLILLVTGETPSASWLLLPVALLLIFLFNTGLGMLLARLVAWSRDLLNLIPVGVRLARYVSGVFFSVSHYVGDHPLGVVLELQPLAVYLTLVRTCLLEEAPLDATVWWWAVGWAVLFLVGGFVVFWRAEASYGRG